MSVESVKEKNQSENKTGRERWWVSQVCKRYVTSEQGLHAHNGFEEAQSWKPWIEKCKQGKKKQVENSLSPTF